MIHADVSFKLASDVRVQVDFAHNTAVISLKTEDGKSIDLEVDYQTLETIHSAIQKELSPL